MMTKLIQMILSKLFPLPKDVPVWMKTSIVRVDRRT